jgi:hypothetical protein
MNGFIKADEIAERWNVSARQVQALCQEGLVESAVKFGNSWAIPEDAKKPTRTGKLKPGRVPKQNNLTERV